MRGGLKTCGESDAARVSPTASPPPEEEEESEDEYELTQPDGIDASEVFGSATDFSTPVLIRPGLFLGSVAAERSLDGLQRLGITHVVQACSLP